MITTFHIDAYRRALGRDDVPAIRAHLAPDIVLAGPLGPRPFRGREQVVQVLGALMVTIDAFEPGLLLREGADFVSLCAIRFREHVIDGVDHLHVNTAGLVDRMTVAWRPLPAMVAIQQDLAPRLGGRAMALSWVARDRHAMRWARPLL